MAAQFRGLESDPVAFSNFIKKGGVENLIFNELYSLDDLSFIPQPVFSVILLYPDENIDGETLIFDNSPTSIAQQENIYFMKQHNVGNACGTIAVIHSIANNLNSIHFKEDKESFLKEFIENTKNNNPIEKCVAMATNENILCASEDCAKEGQTALSEPEDELEYHYICFIKIKETIYELDGMKPGPLPLMNSSDSSFLSDVVQYIKQNYVEKSQGKIQFNIVALCDNLE